MPSRQKTITLAEKEWWRALGKRMRAARKQRGILQKDFVKELDTSLATYCNFENGKARIPVYVFYQACVKLGKCANGMMGRTQRRKP